jgi:hypothetical protein
VRVRPDVTLFGTSGTDRCAIRLEGAGRVPPARAAIVRPRQRCVKVKKGLT